MNPKKAIQILDLECMKCAFAEKCPSEYNCPCRELIILAIEEAEEKE